MREPLFDVIISAYHDTDTGRSAHSVRVVGRYHQHDGTPLGQKDDCTLSEALAFSKQAVTTFLEETEA